MRNNSNLGLVNINAYTKSAKTISIGSQDIFRKRNYGERNGMDGRSHKRILVGYFYVRKTLEQFMLTE